MEKDTYKYIADDDSSLDNIQRTVHFVPRNPSANGHKADHRSLASSSWNLMSRSNFYQLGLLTNKNKNNFIEHYVDVYKRNMLVNDARGSERFNIAQNVCRCIC